MIFTSIVMVVLSANKELKQGHSTEKIVGSRLPIE